MRTHLSFHIWKISVDTVCLEIAFCDATCLKWMATFSTAVPVLRLANDKRTSWQTTSPAKWRMQCAWHL